MVFLELQRDSRVTKGNTGCLSCWPREVQSPFELQGRAGGCSRVSAWQIDFILLVSRNYVFLSSGNRDLWVAFKIHPGSQASSRVEAKKSTLLSSCDGYLVEPTEWPKGSQASCAILREDSGVLSRPSRKRRASCRNDWEIGGLFELCRECGVSYELQWGTQGASHLAPGKSSPFKFRGGVQYCSRVTVGESGLKTG